MWLFSRNCSKFDLKKIAFFKKIEKKIDQPLLHYKFCGRSIFVFQYISVLEDVSVTETIVWCQTIYLKTTIFSVFQKLRYSPTRVTMLKAAPKKQTQSVLWKTDRYMRFLMCIYDLLGFSFPGTYYFQRRAWYPSRALFILHFVEYTEVVHWVVL